MGKGIWILIWDGWGSGLNMINPRLLEKDGNNWFPERDGQTDEQLVHYLITDDHGNVIPKHYKVIK